MIMPESLEHDKAQALEQAEKLLLHEYRSNQFATIVRPFVENLTSMKDTVVSFAASNTLKVAMLTGRILLAPADYAHTLQYRGYRENAAAVRSQSVLIPHVVLAASFFNHTDLGGALTNTALALGFQGVTAIILEALLPQHRR